MRALPFSTKSSFAPPFGYARHYLDLSSHLTRNPFQSEQFRYVKRFERKKNRFCGHQRRRRSRSHQSSRQNAPPTFSMKSLRSRFVFTKAAKATTPSRNGRRKFSFDEAVVPSAHLSRRQIQARQALFRKLRNFASSTPWAQPASSSALRIEVATLPRFIPIA